VGEGFCARVDKVAFAKTKAIINKRKDFLKASGFDFLKRMTIYLNTSISAVVIAFRLSAI